ncbi:helix-turn-helix domain-containing protein [Treponema sp.]|uniref:helix-turn-helix domain-containing protein n=1 Tax=Treponema sp. TaxID=166 RepID=UPI0039A006C9
MRLNFQVLTYFLAIANEESITAACEVLHVTQPTVSRQTWTDPSFIFYSNFSFVCLIHHKKKSAGTKQIVETSVGWRNLWLPLFFKAVYYKWNCTP